MTFSLSQKCSNGYSGNKHHTTASYPCFHALRRGEPGTFYHVCDIKAQFCVGHAQKSVHAGQRACDMIEATTRVITMAQKLLAREVISHNLVD